MRLAPTGGALSQLRIRDTVDNSAELEPIALPAPPQGHSVCAHHRFRHPASQSQSQDAPGPRPLIGKPGHHRVGCLHRCGGLRRCQPCWQLCSRRRCVGAPAPLKPEAPSKTSANPPLTPQQSWPSILKRCGLAWARADLRCAPPGWWRRPARVGPVSEHAALGTLQDRPAQTAPAPALLQYSPPPPPTRPQNSRKGDFSRAKVRGKRAIDLGSGMGLGGHAFALLGEAR